MPLLVGAQRVLLNTGSRVVLQDFFTDADGTALTSHVAEVSPGAWVAAFGGSQKVVSNAATGRVNDDNGAYVSSVAPEFQLNCDFVWSASDDYIGWMARLSTTSNFWFSYYERTTSTWKLVERNGGVDTTRNSLVQALGAGAHSIEIVGSGTIMTVRLDGSLILSYASATFNRDSGGKGIYQNRPGALPISTFDNLLVVAL